MNVMLTIILLVLLNTAYVLPYAVESNKQVSSNISSYVAIYTKIAAVYYVYHSGTM